MLNKVMLIGRLGSDPDLKYFPSGAPYAKFSLATDDSYTDRDGNRVEHTEWHNITVFNKQAENCKSYLTKGSLVYIEGSLQTRKWEDKEGNPRYTTEIRAQRVQFLDRKGDRQPGEAWRPDREDTGGESQYGRAQTSKRAAQEGKSQSVQKTGNRNGRNNSEGGTGAESYDKPPFGFDEGDSGGSEAAMDDLPF